MEGEAGNPRDSICPEITLCLGSPDALGFQSTNELNPWRLHISSMGRLVCLALPVLRQQEEV